MMMRKLLLAAFLFPLLMAQGVAQLSYNCLNFSLKDSIHRLDGEQLLARAIEQGTGITGSAIPLPQDQIQLIANALSAIHNDSSLPYLDEIVNLYKIRTSNEVSSRRLQMLVDTASLWSLGSEINSNQFASGDYELDRLLKDFTISLFAPARYVEMENETYLQVDLISRIPLNIGALVKRLEIIKGVIEARPLLVENTGETTTDIEFEQTSEYYEFTFRYSWNCTDGSSCTNDHFWIYRVYPDCTTEFVKEKGDVLPIREVPGFLSTGIYPNPTTDLVSVQLVGPADQDIRVILFSALGQLLESRTIQTQSGIIELDFSLENQPVGIYFLGLISDGKVFTEKIMKR